MSLRRPVREPRNTGFRPRACGLALLVGAALAPAGCDQAGAGDAEAGGHEGEHEAHRAGAEGHDAGLVAIDERAVERAGIETAAVELGSLGADLVVPAEVQLDPDRVAHVAPLVAGQLLSVGASLGERVEAGQALAVLRSVALGEARAELARARALVDVARSSYERQHTLWREGIAAERDYLEARFELRRAEAERDAARAGLMVFGVSGGSGPDMPIRSPIAGAVTERHATQGENVEAADNLFVVADLSRVLVLGRVYEQDLAALRPDMEATVELRAYPGRAFSGRVSLIASALDEATRSRAVRVVLDNPDGALTPGLFGTLRLRGEPGDDRRVPIVPEAAVQQLEERAVVFVPAGGPGEFRAVPVVTGRRSAGRVEVLDGLEGGERVVAQGAFVLKSQVMRGRLGGGHAH